MTSQTVQTSTKYSVAIATVAKFSGLDLVSVANALDQRFQH